MEMIAISRAQKNEGGRRVMTWRTEKGKKGEENYFFCRWQLWPVQFSGRAVALGSAGWCPVPDLPSGLREALQRSEPPLGTALGLATTVSCLSKISK